MRLTIWSASSRAFSNSKTFTALPTGLLVDSVFGLRCLLWAISSSATLQDRLRAAEVLGQHDDPGVVEIAFEVEDVADVGAAPLVDRLVRVADDAQVRIILRQTAGDGVLGLVGVLVFVDEHVAEAGVQLGPQLLVVLQGQGGPEEQIVEVEALAARIFFS